MEAAVVSEDIQRNRDIYMEIMHEHGTWTPDAIIASVSATQDELLSLFASVPQAQAERNPGPDEWSMLELAQHAAFTERLIAALVRHMARGETPPQEAFEGAGIGMMPSDGPQRYGDVLDELRRMNSDLIDAVRSLPAEPNIEMKLPHPFFGPLNCLEWAGFQRVHDTDHIQHARQILAVVAD